MQTVRPDGTTIYTPFPMYEKEVLGVDTTIRSTYMLGGQAIAVRVVETGGSTSDEVNYIHSDHLGSNTVMTEDDGDAIVGSDALYYPFGGYRYTPTTNPDITDKGYTGHKENRDIGLTYMNARYYVSGIARFASADTIIPNPTNPQSYNRFSYVENRSMNFTDPTGHYLCEDADDCPRTPQPTPRPVSPSPPACGSLSPTYSSSCDYYDWFRSDDAHNDDLRLQRTEMVWTWIKNYDGENWWGQAGELPSIRDLAAFILFQEASLASNSQLVLIASIILGDLGFENGQLDLKGLGRFTAFF